MNANQLFWVLVKIMGVAVLVFGLFCALQAAESMQQLIDGGMASDTAKAMLINTSSPRVEGAFIIAFCMVYIAPKLAECMRWYQGEADLN